MGYMTSPDGKVTKKVGGPQLRKACLANGWTDAEPPEPKKRSRSKKPSTYVNHNNFSGW